MNDADIELALTDQFRLGGLVWPIAYPNQDAPGVVPFITVEIVPTTRTDDTLDGTGRIERGFVMAKAVTQEGRGTTVANRKAEQIAALFRYGARFPVAGGGTISIYRDTEPLQGFPADQKWHKPVRIHFEVF